MKKKSIGLLITVIMTTSFVGCQVANIPSINQNSNDYTVNIKRAHNYVGNQFTEDNYEYYTETPITAGGGSSKKNNILQEISDILLAPNEDIITELAQYKKVYKEPTDVRLTGEIKDNKMYFYYDGYVTTLDGVTQDYNKVIECELDFDFKFDLKDLMFELDEEPTNSFDKVKNDIDAVNAANE